jgi:hypothetical protein
MHRRSASHIARPELPEETAGLPQRFLDDALLSQGTSAMTQSRVGDRRCKAKRLLINIS